MTYENSCGPFTLEVSEPHPMWVTIKHGSGMEQFQLRLMRVEDLHDLRHLIDRALAAAEAHDGGIRV